MLEFKEKQSIVRLDAMDGDIEVSIREESRWDAKKRKHGDDTFFRISVYIEDDLVYNCLELATETLEEAKMVAEDAVRFMKANRPVLAIRREDVDSKD